MERIARSACPATQVLCSSYHRPGVRQGENNVFYFDFGCVVLWGLDTTVERCGAPAAHALPAEFEHACCARFASRI